MTRKEWYNYKRVGPCESCGKRGYRQAHHVVRQQNLPKDLLNDTRNRMLIGPMCCHYGHSNYGVNDRRILYSKVPPAAVAFAKEVLGTGPALEYFRRYYREAP